MGIESETRLRKDGSILSISLYKDHLLHGESRCFYASGQLASEAWFDHGKRQKARFFSPDGILTCELLYHDGLLHGTQRYLTQTGVCLCELPYIQGMFDGALKLFFPDGSLQRQIEMRQGKRHGIDCLWDDSGVITFAFEYEHGHLVRVQMADQIAKVYKLET